MVATKHWLATYEWVSYAPGSSGTWRRENVLLTGDVGVWWAHYLVGTQKRQDNADYRFLYATPITDEGWEALHDKPVGDVKDVRA